MPEGPEIRQAADKIASVLVGKIATRVVFSQHKLRQFGPRLSGCLIKKLETRGKAMLTHFDNGLSIYSHNQLYGRWKIAPAGKIPKTNRQLRLALHTEIKSALLYSASDISVWKTKHLPKHPFLSRIGPDILCEGTTADAVSHRLQYKMFKNRPLHSLLLDQKFLAGVGNYLRSEILFEARLNPELRPCDLNDAAAYNLARAILKISQRSYVSKGITLCPDFFAILKRKRITNKRFYVFNRKGKSCYICDRSILLKKASGRRLYWCENCQSKE